MRAGYKPTQLIPINPHRAAGRRVHAFRATTMLDVAAIAAAIVIATCGAILAWHIITVVWGA